VAGRTVYLDAQAEAGRDSTLAQGMRAR
jgi:hypothetical protein